MKFQKRLEAEAPRLFIRDEHCSALIKYKILKKHIKAMCNQTVQLRRSQVVDNECCICFETFNFAINMISTNCGHNFHPYCLIKSLGTGHCTSCPLCRRPAAGLVSTGYDGDCLRFMAMVLVNSNAVQHCHETSLRILEADLQLYQHALASQRINATTGHPVLAAQISSSLERLELLMQYSALNYDGFRKILKKFDRRSGARPLSPHILPRLESRGFSLDAAAGPDGSRLAELRRQLTAAFRLPPEEPRPLHPPWPCIVPAVSAKCSASAVPAAGLSSAQGSGPVMAG